MSLSIEYTLVGLTDEEAAQLESEDENFYGLSSFDLQAAAGPTESVSDTESEGEELADSGILPQRELQERISAGTCEGDSPAHTSGLVSPDSDPFHSTINQRLTSGCPCADNCLAEFSTSEVFAFYLTLREMTKSEKYMFILGKLHAVIRTGSTEHARQKKAGKRKRATCEYSFDHRAVCKEGFLFLHDLGAKQLKNLQRHLKENGPVPREHGVIGHVSATTYLFKVVSNAVHFIWLYAEVHGIPQPAARSGRAKNPPIYLPVSQLQNCSFKIC